MLKRSSTQRPLSDAFTLVEVTIAIGITASAFVVILGLFASGLKMFSDSTERFVSARIAHGLASEILRADWESLFDSNHTPTQFTTRYFDELGQEVALKSESCYLARPVLFTPSVMAGIDYSSMGEPEFGRVVIEVYNLPRADDPPADIDTGLWIPAQKDRLCRFPFTIARHSP